MTGYLDGGVPDELLLEFLRYLDRKDLANLRMTSSKLKSVVQAMFFDKTTLRLGRVVSTGNVHAGIKDLAATLTACTRNLYVDVPEDPRAQALCETLFKNMGTTGLVSLTFTASSRLERMATSAISLWLQKLRTISTISLPGSYSTNGKKNGRRTAHFKGSLVFGDGSRHVTVNFKDGDYGTDLNLLKGVAKSMGEDTKLEVIMARTSMRPNYLRTFLRTIGFRLSTSLPVPVLYMEMGDFDCMTDSDLNVFDFGAVRQVVLIHYASPGRFLRRLASAAHATSPLKLFSISAAHELATQQNIESIQEGLIDVLNSFGGLTEITIRIGIPLKLSVLDVIHHSDLTTLVYLPNDISIPPTHLEHLRRTCKNLKILEFRCDTLVHPLRTGHFDTQFFTGHELIVEQLAKFTVLEDVTLHTELYAGSFPPNKFIGFDPKMSVTRVLLEKSVEMILAKEPHTSIKRLCVCVNKAAEYEGLAPDSKAEVTFESSGDWKDGAVFTHMGL